MLEALHQWLIALIRSIRIKPITTEPNNTRIPDKDIYKGIGMTKIMIKQGGKLGDVHGRKFLAKGESSTDRAVKALLDVAVVGPFRPWSGVIVHHSATVDGKAYDEPAITKYHRSYRLDGNIISEDKAKTYISQGKRVQEPWSDVGYHFLIEDTDEGIVVWRGRPLNVMGAHCSDQGKNKTHIGLCVIGAYDKVEPPASIYNVTRALIEVLQGHFKFTPAAVEPHNKYAKKTCPGKMFQMSNVVPTPSSPMEI